MLLNILACICKVVDLDPGTVVVRRRRRR